MIKPPYAVPSMKQIGRIQPNGFKVISTFAGCGGSSLGYRMAGFKVLWASEFIDQARKDYQANAAPGTIVDGRDIRLVKPEEILEATGLRVGELDVLDGSPPCSSFSTAGKREKHWGQEKKYSDKSQRTDDLFYEFIRIRNGLKPRVFVAENVSGLVKGTAKGYFLDILKQMQKGYIVKAALLDAQWLGVPQARQRIIFVGVREDLGVQPAHPIPLRYRYSVREAIPWIGDVEFSTGGRNQAKDPRQGDRPAHSITAGAKNATHHKVRIVQGNGSGHSSNRGDEVSINRPSPSINAGSKGSGPHQFYIERETDISKQAIGREYDKLSPGEQSDKYFSLVKTDASQPCPTVTAAGGMNSGIACVTHPTEKRKFSIAELKRICAFPDDFALSGSYAQQWERLGRAVPPLMMKAIAETVRDRILAGAQSRARPREESGRRPSRSARR